MNSKYQSLFSPGKEISAAQYIVELCCKNKAKSNKITLPTQFWKLPEWQTFFIVQIKKANEYLEKYHEVILIKIIKEKNIYSLHAKWIDKEFRAETNKTLDFAREITSKIDELEYKRNTNSLGSLEKNKDINLDYLDG